MKLNIFGRIVNVMKRKKMTEQTGCTGLFYPTEGRIELEAELVGDEYMQVLIHEIIHCVIHRVGIDQARIGDGVEEILCESVSTALVENFKIQKK